MEANQLEIAYVQLTISPTDQILDSTTVLKGLLEPVKYASKTHIKI